jgi:hypothetical protein
MLGLAHNASPELVFWRKRALDLAHDNHTLRAENVRLRDELATTLVLVIAIGGGKK